MDDKEIIRRIAVEAMGWQEITEPMRTPEIWRIVRRAGVPHWLIDFVGRFIVYDLKPQQGREWNPLESIADAFEMEAMISTLGWFPQYRPQLGRIVTGRLVMGLIADDDVDLMLKATARQRCEAVIGMLEVKA